MRAICNRLMLLASASFLWAYPLLADVPADGSSPATVTAWVSAVEARLDTAMVEPQDAAGLVTARFRRGDSGLATDVEIVDATLAMERAARATLSRLGQLPPLPHGVDPHQPIKLQLLFGTATSVQSYQAQLRAMEAGANAANSRFSDRMVWIPASITPTP